MGIYLNFKESRKFYQKYFTFFQKFSMIYKKVRNMILIKQYADFILNNLPEWNYSQALHNEEVMLQKQIFAKAVSLIDETQEIDLQLKQLGKIIKDFVPDNHISLFDSQHRQLVAKKEPPYSRQAYNLSYKSSEELKDLGIKEFRHFKMQTGQPQWMIASQQKGNFNIGIVAIPSFGGNAEMQAQARKEFVTEFFEEKEQHKWHNIIFDFRGNSGGDAELIKEIGERMSEKSLNYADLCEVIEAKPQNEAQAKILNSQGHIRQQTTQYQSQNEDKFRGNIYILQDAWCASASEGAIFMLSQIPNSKTIGENTSGTFAGGACTEIPFEQGSLIIGTEYRKRSRNGKEIKEKEGQTPDIETPSKEAYTKACQIILNQQIQTLSLWRSNQRRE